ncbi:hypothetical protein M0R45_007156 [Rubus argutus]|uniref:Uncharacterized protein n=1 Tax=Rubus argutus TaxID=59490 RepID=A0AAW1YSM7_RUBAR
MAFLNRPSDLGGLVRRRCWERSRRRDCSGKGSAVVAWNDAGDDHRLGCDGLWVSWIEHGEALVWVLVKTATARRRGLPEMMAACHIGSSTGSIGLPRRCGWGRKSGLGSLLLLLSVLSLFFLGSFSSKQREQLAGKDVGHVVTMVAMASNKVMRAWARRRRRRGAAR